MSWGDGSSRVGRGDYAAWRRQVQRAGFCSRPIRVRGRAMAVDRATGEIRREYSTQDQPDQTLLLACGDRRASACAACAEVYRRDMFHVVAAGIAGCSAPGEGQGLRQRVAAAAVPSSVARHPRVFATVTGPSFGAVHTARDGGVCHARSPRQRCTHGNPVGCGMRHGPDEVGVGTPLCARCYDYVGAVLFNAVVGELWRRTRIAIDRALAPLASRHLGRRITVAEVAHLLRVSYVKVAEFQRRGVVHLHAVLRMDGPEGPGDPPPAWATAQVLQAAVRRAVEHTTLELPCPDGRLRSAYWGSQYDVSDVTPTTETTNNADSARLAAYLAKYATKTAGDAVGVLVRRLTRLSRSWLTHKLGPHLARMVETAWNLGTRADLAHLRLRKWAHCLGFRGHFASKSRRYSLTLGLLRQTRRAWRSRNNPDDVWNAGATTTVVGDWRYVGRGYATFDDAALVETLAREYDIARLEYRAHKSREKFVVAHVMYWLTPA